MSEVLNSLQVITAVVCMWAAFLYRKDPAEFRGLAILSIVAAILSQ